MIKCKKCGYENPDGNKFCENCGAECKPASKKKLIISIIIAVIVLIGAAAIVTMYLGGKTSAEYNNAVKDADRYMQQLEYEKAEASYLTAIEIDSKEDDAYIKLSDVYIAQEKYEEAEEILDEGKEKAGGKEIEEKLEQVKSYGIYDEYINETMIPEIGLADTEVKKTADKFNSGLVSAMVEDFNKDDTPDLLAVSYEQSSSSELTISLYTCENEEVVLKDTAGLHYEDDSVMARRANVFIKKHEDKTLLIVGREDLYANEWYDTAEIYEVSDNINKLCSLEYFFTWGICQYTVNGENVCGYDYSNAEMDSEIDLVNGEEAKATNIMGIDAFAKALEPYGIGEDRFVVSNDSPNSIKLLECDQEDKTETLICYIQHGEFMEDDSVDFAKQDLRYIVDYTNY